MVNGFRYYRALESVCIASALSTALTIYPCHIRVNQRWQSNFLQLGRRSGGRPQQTVHPMRLPVNCDTHYFSRPWTRNLPIVGWLLVRRATSSAIDTQRWNKISVRFLDGGLLW